MGYQYIPQRIVSYSNETASSKGFINQYQNRITEEYKERRTLIGDVVGGLLEVAASIFTFGSSLVGSVGAKVIDIVARSTIRNTAFVANTLSKVARTTTTAAITGSIGLTKDFVSGKSAEEAFTRYGTLIGSAAATGFVGGLIKQPLSNLTTKTKIFLKNFNKDLYGNSLFNRSVSNFSNTSLYKNNYVDVLGNTNSKIIKKTILNIERIKTLVQNNRLSHFLENIPNNYKTQRLVENSNKLIYKLHDINLYVNKLGRLNLQKSSILDDLLSGGLFNNLNTKLGVIFRKFFNRKITESVLYKKSIELLNEFDTKLSDSFKIFKKLEQKQLESFKDFQNKFSLKNILENYNNYFKRNYEELNDRLKTDLSSVETLKLEQDMNNYVLESNGALPFKNDGEGVIDINKSADKQEGRFGSKWILGWKWYPELDDDNEIIFEGNGNLRVFFKSRIPKIKTKTLKKGKNKGKKVFKKAMKGTILFIDVPYKVMKEFTENTNPGSFYWYNFAKRPLKGGGKTKGWEPRRYADIDFLNKINQQKRDRLIKQWGLGNRGITTTLTRKLGFLSASKINFKYYNTQKVIKTVFRSPAANIKKGISSALSINH